nr:unnamed protein product [Callosobruchus chinensis]
MPRLRLPEVTLDQHSCSICLKYDDQCKDKKLLDITQTDDGDKSCLDKIQELMHVEIVLGYQTICIDCATEVNDAYLLRGKIIEAISFWKKHFGYEEASELNESTEVQPDNTPIKKVEYDDSITTIPKTDKIEIEEESDDDANTPMGHQDFDSDDEPLGCKKARLLKDSNSNATSPDVKVKKDDSETKKEPKNEILGDLIDLTAEKLSIIPEASIKNLPGATIKKVSDVKKEEEKENNDSKKLTLFCGRCSYYYANLSEIMSHFCIERNSNNQKKKLPKPHVAN